MALKLPLEQAQNVPFPSHNETKEAMVLKPEYDFLKLQKDICPSPPCV
jgi:hypothetical protein